MGFSVPEYGFDYSFHSKNDSIASFLTSMIRRPAILSFSCAAGLGAVDIAYRYPHLVEKVVLIQTPSWEEEVIWKNSRDPKRILATPVAGQIAMRLLKRRRAPAWLNLAVGNRRFYDPFCDNAEVTLKAGAGWAMASAFQLYLTDTGPDLPVIDQPLLALWGHLDQTHLNTDKQSSLQLAIEGEIQIYDNLGHFPDLEGVQTVFDDISHFAAANG